MTRLQAPFILHHNSRVPLQPNAYTDESLPNALINFDLKCTTGSYRNENSTTKNNRGRAGGGTSRKIRLFPRNS